MYASPTPSDRPPSATATSLSQPLSKINNDSFIRPENLVYISLKGDPREHETVPAQTKWPGLVNAQWLKAEERALKGKDEVPRCNLYDQHKNPREWALDQELVKYYKIQHQ